jgi:hypothetical protein
VSLGLLAGHRHPPGADLELDRGRADADQARPAALDTLGVATVAGHTAHVEQRLALGGGAGQLRVVLRLGTRGEDGVGAAGEHQRGDQPDRGAQPAAAPAARGGPLTQPREQTASAVVVRSHERCP